MSTTLTDDELSEWESLCAAATPGERETGLWQCYNGFGPMEDGLMRCERIGTPAIYPGGYVLWSEWESKDLKGRREDLEFIAHSRRAMPLLLAEVRRLREARTR